MPLSVFIISIRDIVFSLFTDISDFVCIDFIEFLMRFV